MADGARRIRVNDIGEYIRHKSCDRRFYLTLNHDQESKALPFFDRLLNQFEPILARVGRQHEEQWKDELEASGFVDAGKDLPKSEHNGIEWHDLTLKLADLPEATQAYAREVRVEGDIGAFWLSGQIDFILIRKENGRVRFTLVE